jgi:hypothetical protein
MHTLLNIHPPTTLHYYINMDAITAALKDVTLQDKLDISATGRKHQVDRSLLSRRFRSVTTVGGQARKRAWADAANECYCSL